VAGFVAVFKLAGEVRKSTVEISQLGDATLKLGPPVLG
jgi:hypothetical protein